MPQKKPDVVQWNSAELGQAIPDPDPNTAWDMPQPGQASQLPTGMQDPSSEESPLRKFGNTFVEPFEQMGQAFTHPIEASRAMNPVAQFIDNPGVESGLGVVAPFFKSSIYDPGKQVAQDISHGGYAEALGHGINAALPFLGIGAEESVRPNVAPFLRGAARELPSARDIRWGGLPVLGGMASEMTGHGFWPGMMAGAAGDVLIKAPKMIRAGLDEVRGIPAAAESEWMKARYPRAGGIPNVENISPERAPSVIPASGGLKSRGEYLGPRYELPDVAHVEAPPGVDPEMAQPHLVKTESESSKTPASREKSKPSLVLDEREQQGIENRRANAKAMADRLDPYFNAFDPKEILRWGEEKDEEAYHNALKFANETHMNLKKSAEGLPVKGKIGAHHIYGRGYEELARRAAERSKAELSLPSLPQ